MESLSLTSLLEGVPGGGANSALGMAGWVCKAGVGLSDALGTTGEEPRQAGVSRVLFLNEGHSYFSSLRER